jgi:diguanylate cyclase (GGDEF)-like protein
MTKILVIEDERILRKSLVRLLIAEGFDVLSAENGRIGVELAKAESPKLILCDLMMPEVDGFQVLSELQSNPDTAMIPFICLTAQEERTALRQVMELGGNDFLTKPFTRLELLRAINTQLAKHQRIIKNQKQAVEEVIVNLTNQVYYDGLTNLPNRILLRDRFEKLVKEIDEENKLIPIMVITLNQLERLTEGLGLDYVDILFETLITRINEDIGENNTIVRLNNEQVILLYSPVDSQETITEVVQKIIESFNKPFTLVGYQVILSSSIGISLYPNHGEEFDTLLKNANIAAHQGKQKRQNGYEFYSDAISVKSKDRLLLEINLRQAIQQNQFYIHYQPQVNLKTRKIVGAEALIRWQHPEKGRVSPAEFIPIAEETGLIIDLDEWVLNAVCKQVKQWQNQNIFIPVAVNLSGLQFSRQGLVKRVLKILDETNLNANYIELELTESAVVQNPELAEQILYDLKKLGFKLSLDDFGTGYSSLSYLHQFPFDKLKIDRCFVADITNNPRNAAIITGTILMAHGLTLNVVAEGVETDAEAEFLEKNNCDTIQGYWYSPPISVDEFEKLFRQNNASYN